MVALAPSPVAGHPIAGAHREAVQQRLEAIWIAKGPDVTPGGDQRVLDSVLGKVVVSQDQLRDPIQTAD